MISLFFFDSKIIGIFPTGIDSLCNLLQLIKTSRIAYTKISFLYYFCLYMKSCQRTSLAPRLKAKADAKIDQIFFIRKTFCDFF